jgi:hypothetical protein
LQQNKVLFYLSIIYIIQEKSEWQEVLAISRIKGGLACAYNTFFNPCYAWRKTREW